MLGLNTPQSAPPTCFIPAKVHPIHTAVAHLDSLFLLLLHHNSVLLVGSQILVFVEDIQAMLLCYVAGSLVIIVVY